MLHGSHDPYALDGLHALDGYLALRLELDVQAHAELGASHAHGHPGARGARFVPAQAGLLGWQKALAAVRRAASNESWAC